MDDLCNGPHGQCVVQRTHTRCTSSRKRGVTPMRVDSVMVPLDGSGMAEAALPKAIELVKANPGAVLILLRAVEAPEPLGVDPIHAMAAAAREAEEYLA